MAGGVDLDANLRACVAAGQPFDLSAGTNAELIDTWGPERTVQADTLRDLLTGAGPGPGASPGPGAGSGPGATFTPSGIMLRMVVVAGRLDLTGAELRCPVGFDTCRFDSSSPIGLSLVTAPRVEICGCKLSGVSGQMLTVKKGLDLSGSTLSRWLLLEDADITGGLSCEEMRIDGADSRNFSFCGSGLKAAGGVRLSGLRCKGAIDLSDADIIGALSLHGAQVNGEEKRRGDALAAAGIRVGSGAYLDGGFLAKGRVNLLDAQITGQLSLRAATIETGGKVSFAGDRMSVTSGAWLDRSDASPRLGQAPGEVPTFTASGPVRMSGATIGGQLSFAGAKVNTTAIAGQAVWADEIKVAAGASFIETMIKGTLSLSGAAITGWVNLDRAQIDGRASGGFAVSAPGIKLTGGLSLTGLSAVGGVVLSNATVGADVRFDDVTVKDSSSGWNRKIAAGLRAGRQHVISPGAVPTGGGVVLTGAEIGGTLRFVRARITSIDVVGVAVKAPSLTVKGGLWLGKPPEEGAIAEGDLVVEGAVVLTDACVTGQLGLRGARLNGLDTRGRGLVAERLTVTGGALFDDVDSVAGMVLAGSQISGELAWLPGRAVTWPLDLSGVTAARLCDDGHWPGPGPGLLKLNGFKYSAFSGPRAATLAERLSWIRSQYDQGQRAPMPWRKRTPAPASASAFFSPQPYQQLADVYRGSGQDDDATEVDIAANADRRQWGGLKPGAWWSNALFDVTIKFGYRSWRAIAGLLAVYVLAVVAFTVAQSQHDLIIPTGSITGISPAPTASQCSKGYPCFYPAGFAIDIVVPIINVHQADAWAVSGNASWGWAWVGGTWIATGLGWAFVTLFVAGYTGLVRSD